jgi:hypothetical protein
MATRFSELEKMDVVPLILPVDINGLTGADSNYASTKGYDHVMIVVLAGAVAGSSAMVIKRATTTDGGSAETWTGWDYMALNANPSAYNAEDATETNDYTMTAVSSYTYAIAAANQAIVVEFDPIHLGGGSWDCFGLGFTDPGAADIVSAVALMFKSRYTGTGGTNAPNARTD